MTELLVPPTQVAPDLKVFVGCVVDAEVLEEIWAMGRVGWQTVGPQEKWRGKLGLK